MKYRNFVGEWGHVLDQVTNITGRYPGEIDRIFWGALGSEHFLQKGKGRYRSFMFQATEENDRLDMPSRFYDGIDPSGQSMVVLKLDNL